MIKFHVASVTNNDLEDFFLEFGSVCTGSKAGHETTTTKTDQGRILNRLVSSKDPG